MDFEAPKRVKHPFPVDTSFTAPSGHHGRCTCLLSLLYGCGIRLGEALALTRDDAKAAYRGYLTVTGKGARVLSDLKVRRPIWTARSRYRRRRTSPILGTLQEALGRHGSLREMAFIVFDL